MGLNRPTLAGLVTIAAALAAGVALAQTPAASPAGHYHGQGMPAPVGQATHDTRPAEVVINRASTGAYTIVLADPGGAATCTFPLTSDATGLAFVPNSNCAVAGGGTVSVLTGRVTVTGAAIAITATMRFSAGTTVVPMAYEYHGTR